MRKKMILVYLDKTQVKFLGEKIRLGYKISSYVRKLIEDDMKNSG